MKERVLLVHNFYQIGGGEHVVFENEKRLLLENGHEVTVYTRDNAELKGSLPKKLLLPFTAVFSLKTYREVKRIIREKGIDVVHCHNTFPLISPSVYYAAWKCGVPAVQTVHNFRFLCPNALFFRDGRVCEDCTAKGLSCAVKRGCYRNSRLQTLVVVNMLRVHRMLGTYKKLRYIFLTEFNREKFRPLLGGRTDSAFIKGNFEYIAPPKEARNANAFVFIGRLDLNKGIAFLLKAWEAESRRELYIFGDGRYKDEVLKAQQRQANIHYMGFQKQDVVFRYLASASALVFPSDCYEGFPMTIIEAFACGTPVVCADIGNQADIVRETDAGILYEGGNIESFRQALDALAKNAARLGENAEKAFLEKYSPDASYKKLKEIYEAIAK